MKNEKTIVEIDVEGMDAVNDILDKSYINLNMLFQMVVNRTLQEGSINWITQNQQSKPTISTGRCENLVVDERRYIYNSSRMTKSIARRMFVGKGSKVNQECTFASKNKSTNTYWANPNFQVVENDWSLILNNNISRELYLFNIPKYKFDKNKFTPRADDLNKIDMQIMYNDPTFTDNRSGVSFSEFLVDTIKY